MALAVSEIRYWDAGLAVNSITETSSTGIEQSDNALSETGIVMGDQLKSQFKYEKLDTDFQDNEATMLSSASKTFGGYDELMANNKAPVDQMACESFSVQGRQMGDLDSRESFLSRSTHGHNQVISSQIYSAQAYYNQLNVSEYSNPNYSYQSPQEGVMHSPFNDHHHHHPHHRPTQWVAPVSSNGHHVRMAGTPTFNTSTSNTTYSNNSSPSSTSASPSPQYARHLSSLKGGLNYTAVSRAKLSATELHNVAKASDATGTPASNYGSAQSHCSNGKILNKCSCQGRKFF